MNDFAVQCHFYITGRRHSANCYLSSSSVSSFKNRTGSLQDITIFAALGQDKDRDNSLSPSYSSVCLGYMRQVSQSASGPNAL